MPQIENMLDSYSTTTETLINVLLREIICNFKLCEHKILKILGTPMLVGAPKNRWTPKLQFTLIHYLFTDSFAHVNRLYTSNFCIYSSEFCGSSPSVFITA